jgi:hypothetical protein
MENRLKELKHGLTMDRTRCERFMANQCRVLLTAAACILLQTLQAHARGPPAPTPGSARSRERLFKLAAWIRAGTGGSRAAAAHPESLVFEIRGVARTA